MSEAPYNPGDARLLLSRALDGDLTPEEQRQLEGLLAGSEELRAENAELGAVNALVRQWGSLTPEIGWNSHERVLHERLASEARDTEGGRLDDLLSRWRWRRPELDWDRHAEKVLAELRKAQSRSLWTRRVIRIGAPLAMAAALVMAVTIRFWAPPGPTPVCVVELDVGGLGRGASTRFALGSVVEFDRDVTGPAETSAPVVSFISLGAGPPIPNGAEGSPL